MHDTNGSIAPHALNSSLRPLVSKLEFLSRLAPILETDEEYGEAVLLINEMVRDYAGQLRRALDGLVINGGNGHG